MKKKTETSLATLVKLLDRGIINDKEIRLLIGLPFSKVEGPIKEKEKEKK